MIDRIRASLIAGALLSTVAVAPAHGQEVAEARWLAFVGCWEAVNSDVESGLLCFMPASDGVEMFNVVDGNIASTEILVADGEQRAVSAEGCEGWESIDFSADGRRAFTRSEFVCGEAARSGTGIMAVTAPNQWVDVRSLDVDGEAVAWVQEYRLAGPDRLALEGMSDPVAGIGMAVSTSRRVASAAIDIADVEEAARHVDSKVLETWLAAQQDHFELNGSEIARLADSGVPASVIDVMVAVTYPEKFMV
ncbi:MAG: hypothetical protein O2956_14895, partial [Gemmatimonadetes bacterium]|nr:hypothetical protein [Gemmatimonadota bacterium]